MIVMKYLFPNEFKLCGSGIPCHVSTVMIYIYIFFFGYAFRALHLVPPPYSRIGLTWYKNHFTPRSAFCYLNMFRKKHVCHSIMVDFSMLLLWASIIWLHICLKECIIVLKNGWIFFGRKLCFFFICSIWLNSQHIA